MGLASVLFFYHDGLKEPRDGRSELTNAVGEAALELCLERKDILGSDGQPRQKDWAGVLSHGNCVRWVDDVHASDEKLYFWFGNTMRSIDKLDDGDLARAMDLLRKEQKRRERQIK